MSNKKADTAADTAAAAEIASVENPATDAAATETNGVEAPNGEVTDDTGSVETDGTRARRAIMLKQFLPDPEWILKNVVAGGKGTRATIGRIFGIATGTARKTNTLPDGSVSESIAVSGVFQSEGFLTGELSEASGVYFPMAYAEKIEALIKMGVKTIEVDCDIGVEATGKTIPYEWVVTAFREGKEMDVLKRIRGTRARPANILVDGTGEPKAIAATAQKALSAA